MNALFAIAMTSFSFSLIGMSYLIRKTARIRSSLQDVMNTKIQRLKGESFNVSPTASLFKSSVDLNNKELQYMLEKFTLLGRLDEASQKLVILKNATSSKILYYDFLETCTCFYSDFNLKIEQLLIRFNESFEKPSNN